MKNTVYFYWHAFFLALTKNFMDVNTVIPALLISAGGTEFHLGLLTTITIGGSKFSRIFFGGWLSPKPFKKKYLLLGVNLRVLSLLSLAILLLYSNHLSENTIIMLIFALMTLFSISGAFSTIPYTDILGKSLKTDERTRFFFWKSFSKLPEILKKDKKLVNYLIISNLVGLGIAIIPFYVSLGKQSFNLSPEKVGTWLLVQIIGMILSNFLWKRLSRNHGYKLILYTFISINFILPILALFLSVNFYSYLIVFLLSGFALSAYEIVIGGILIEISNESNRSFYAGISGIGSFFAVLYPLIAGTLIRLIGYVPVFAATSILATIGFIFASRLNCKE